MAGAPVRRDGALFGMVSVIPLGFDNGQGREFIAEPGVVRQRPLHVRHVSNGFNSTADVATTPSGAPAYLAAGYADHES